MGFQNRRDPLSKEWAFGLRPIEETLGLLPYKLHMLISQLFAASGPEVANVGSLEWRKPKSNFLLFLSQ